MGQAATLTLSQAHRRWEQMHDADPKEVSVAESYKRSAWCYGAITQIASMVSQTPFAISDGDRPVDTGPLVKLSRMPNRRDQQNTSTKFRNAYMTEILLNGAVMRVFTEINGHVPSEMAAFPRWKYRADDFVDEHGAKMVRKWILHSFGRTTNYIPGDEIYHDALFNPYHDYEGLAPLAAALIGINNNINSGEFANRFYRNDGSTGVIFSSEHVRFDQKAADEAAERYNELHGGVDKAYRAKFIGYGLKPHIIGNPFDATAQQILNSMTKEEIVTGIFKIPLEIFGSRPPATSGVTIGDKSPDTAKETFLVNVIIPWARRYDEEFNRDVAWRFGSNLRGEHDFTENPILERRRLERAKAAAELIDRGVVLNEVIEWLNLRISPQPHGSEWWVENNKVPASVIQRAGDKALNLATGKAREQALTEHIDQIVRMSMQASVAELARSDVRRNGSAEGKSNVERITELMSP